MMFYDHSKKSMFSVIWAGIYTIIYGYICIDYLGLLQDKSSKDYNRFEKTKLTNLSGLVMSEILMNIMSFHGFFKYPISKFILSCRSDLVLYYVSEWFIIVET